MHTRCFLSLALLLTVAAPASAAEVHGLAYSPDGKLLSALKDKVGFVFDAATGKLVATIEGDAADGLLFALDGRSLFGFTGSTIQEWDLAGKPLRKHATPHPIRAITRSLDGRSLLVAVDRPTGERDVLVMDAASGRVEKTLTTPGKPEGHRGNDVITLSPDGKRVVVGSGDVVDLATGLVGSSENKLGRRVVAWMPDGKKIFAIDGTEGYFVDAASPGEDSRGYPLVEQQKVVLHNHHPSSALVIGDGKWLAVATDRGLEWWRRNDNLAEARLYVDDAYTFNVAWTAGGTLGAAFGAVYSPDQSVIAVAGETDISLLDANSNNGALLRRFKVERAPAAVAAAPVVVKKAEPAPLSPEQKSLVDKVSTQASQTCAQLVKLENPVEYRNDIRYENQVRGLIFMAQGCSPSVAAARKGGVAETTPIEFHRYESSAVSPLPLAEIEAKICKPMEQLATAALKVRTTDLEKRREPYLKVLDGDKAKIFMKLDMVNGIGYYFGRHKKPLRTPEDFKSSDVWYWYVHLSTHAYPEWKVEGYKFQGMTKLEGYEHTGPGTEPPASEFK